MRTTHLKLLKAFCFLLLTIVAIPDADAADISNGDIVTAPPQPDEAMNFLAPAPGGTFIIEAGVTFVGAITNDAAGVGTLVLNSGSQLDGAVGQSVGPLLQIDINGNSTINGAISAQTFNLGENTLTAVGALNLPSGIVLNTRVVSNALFGHIADTGANSIAGESVTVNVDASGVVALTPGEPLFIISAQGTTTALPVNVTSNNVLYSFSGENLNGNILITPTLNPAAETDEGAGTILPGIVDVAASDPDSDIATVLAAIAALPSAEAIANALLQFDPIVDGALARMSFTTAKQFQQFWATHMTNGRCVYAERCCETDCSGCYCCKNADCNCYSVCNRWEIWVEGFGLWGHQDNQRGFSKYNADLYGGMAGVQGPICQELSAGIGVGYAHTHVNRAHNNDSTIQVYDGTVYLSFNPTHFYLDAAFSFDFNKYEDKRHINFPGVDRTARADYVGRQYTALLAGGYRYYRWCAIFTPLASIQYSYLNINKYHEHGAQDLNLHVEGQHYNFLESSLGFKIARPIQTTCGAFIPEVHALWLHNFYRNAMQLKTTLSGVAAQAGTFETDGPPGLDTNSGDVGAGITFISCTNLSVAAIYNYEFSKHWDAHRALVRIAYQF